MQTFIMHVGSPGNIDLDYTVSQTRSIEEILVNLPTDAPEKSFFESEEFRKQFPNGTFNCWGVPIKAKPSFERTNVGDLVLFCPEIGDAGGISYVGIVKAKCPTEAYGASRILWPDTPNERLFPRLFFFDTESGFLPWYDFLAEVGMSSEWNPRGWYRKIDGKRFETWNKSEGYLEHLRKDFRFSFLGNNTDLYKSEIELATENIEVITGKRTSTRQGFSASPKLRRAIELYAMAQATEYLINEGWTVSDVSSNKPYDLLCNRKGVTLFVEVKGTTTIGEQILLTRNEVQHAKNNQPNVALFIVSQVKVEKNGDDDFIVTGGNNNFIHPWVIVEEKLSPLSYSYSVI